MGIIIKYIYNIHKHDRVNRLRASYKLLSVINFGRPG